MYLWYLGDLFHIPKSQISVGLFVLSAWSGFRVEWCVVVCFTYYIIKLYFNCLIIGLVHDQLVDKPNLIIDLIWLKYWMTDWVLSGVPKASAGKVVDLVCATKHWRIVYIWWTEIPPAIVNEENEKDLILNYVSFVEW